MALLQALNVFRLISELLLKLSCQLASVVSPAQLQLLKLALCVLPILIQSNYHVDRSKDLENEPTDESHWDFIVVGAGSAGALVANRLMTSPDNFAVLTLEAGGKPSVTSHVPGISFFAPPDNPYDWRYKTVPQKNCCFAVEDQTLLVPRGKVLGGTSLLNFMMYLSGNRMDYENWAALSDDQSWNYANMSKAILKHEHHTGKHWRSHGCGGEMNVDRNRYEGRPKDLFLEAMKEFEKAGIFIDKDCNRDQDNCINSIESTVSCGFRWNTNTAFLLGTTFPKRNRIQKYSQVTKLIYDETTTPPTVIGVEYVWHYDPSDTSKPVKVHRVYAKREVILCAGAINSPQILQNSGIGPKDYLEGLGIKSISNLKCGKTLKDHVGVPLNFQHRKGCGSSFVPERDGAAGALKTLWFDPKSECLGHSFLQGTYVLGTSFTRSSKSDTPGYPDIQNLYIAVSQLSSLIGPATRLFFNFKPEELKAWVKKGETGRDGMLAIGYLGRPKSVGSVTLNKNFQNLPPPHRYLAPPSIDPNYFSDPEGHDLEVLIEAAQKMYRQLLDNPTYKKLDIAFVGGATRCNEYAKGDDFGNPEFWRCYVLNYTMSIWHWCRSCKMGREDDPEACVDSRLRVFGVKGLRVVDCSVMPEPPNCNTNAPVMAVAEKAAEMILHDNNAEPAEEPKIKLCDGTEKPYQLPDKVADEILKNLEDLKDIWKDSGDDAMLKLIKSKSVDAEDFKKQAAGFATCSADVLRSLNL